MKTNARKFLSLLLSFLMVFGSVVTLLPTTVMAAETNEAAGFTGNYVVYSAEDIVEQSLASTNGNFEVKGLVEATDTNNYTANYVRFAPKAAKVNGTNTSASSDRVFVYLPEGEEPKYANPHVEGDVNDYNYIVVGYKTNITTTDNTLHFVYTVPGGSFSGNKVESICYNTFNSRVSTNTTTKLQVATKKLNSTYTEATAEPYLDYIRFLPTATDAIVYTSDMFFDIEYVAFFEKEADATAFDYVEYNKKTVVVKSADGTELVNAKYSPCTTVDLFDEIDLPYVNSKGEFLTLVDAESNVYSATEYKVTDDATLTADYSAVSVFDATTLYNAETTGTGQLSNAGTTKTLEDGYVKYIPNLGASHTGVSYFDISINYRYPGTEKLPVGALMYKSYIKEVKAGSENIHLTMVTDAGNKTAMLGYKNGIYDGSDNVIVRDWSAGLAGVTQINKIRLLPWAHHTNDGGGHAMNDGDYFSIKYLAFFETKDAVSIFDFDAYKYSLENDLYVTLNDENGVAISTKYVVKNDEFTFPTYTPSDNKIFLGWKSSDGTMYSSNETITVNKTDTYAAVTIKSVIITPEELLTESAGKSATLSIVTEGGNTYLRATMSGTSGHGINWTIDPVIDATVYQVAKISYRTNLKVVKQGDPLAETEGAFALQLSKDNTFNWQAKYFELVKYNFWTKNSTEISVGETVFDMTGKAAAAGTDVFEYFRILPFNGQTPTAIDGTGTLYFDIEYIAFFETKSDAEAFDYNDYYASLPKATVTFLDKNGGTITSGEYLEGLTVTLPEAPVVGGFRFVGWSDGVSDELITEAFTATEDVTLTAVYESECVIITAADIAEAGNPEDLPGVGAVGSIINKGLTDDGSMVRFVVDPDKVGEAANKIDRLAIKVNNIAFADYPHIVMAYKTNITATQINFNISTVNGAYSSSENKIFAGQTRTVDELAIAKYTYGNSYGSLAEVAGVYVPIYSTTTPVMSADDYMDVLYVGFFKDAEAAAAFVYEDYIADLPEFTVTFEDGEGNVLSGETYSGNQTVELPQDFEPSAPEGTEFFGWSTGEEGAKVYSNSFVATENATYYPVYKKAYTIYLTATDGGKVSYNGGGVPGNSFEIKAYEGQNFVFKAFPDTMVITGGDGKDKTVKTHYLRAWHDLTNGQLDVIGTSESISYTVNMDDPRDTFHINANFVPNEIKPKVRLVAFTGRGTEGYFTANGAGTYTYFDDYVSLEDTVTLMAFGVNGYTPVGWMRFTQDSNTEVLIGLGAQISVPALGSSVFYQPVFAPANAQANIFVNKATREIIAKEGTEAPTGYGYNPEEDVVAVNDNIKVYYCTKNYVADEENSLEVYALGSNEPVTTAKNPAYASSWKISTDRDDTKWQMSINEGSFIDVSYDKVFNFTYNFKDKTTVVIKEVERGEDAPTPAIKTVMSWVDETEGTTKFTGLFVLPEGCTLLSHGVLMSQTASELSNAEFVDGQINAAEGVIVGHIRDNTENATSLFTISKKHNTQGTNEWYGRAFLVYSDVNGTHCMLAETIPTPAV